MERIKDVGGYIVREKEWINNDLSTYLKRHEQKEMLRLLVAGSVDDGKSTLIGRLLYDSHLIYKDHLEAIYRDSKTYNTTQNEIDLSLLTDGLKAEREQGITIDVAYRYFSTEKRSFIICDAPGHEQYTRNMATGASHCDIALILIDARNGVKAQTRRHSLIASIMGIRNVIVVINKMDLVYYEETVFDTIRQDYLAFSQKLDFDNIHFIPISALTGENVVTASQEMPWFLGGPLLNYIETCQIAGSRNLIDFRFPVQYVIRPDSSFRGYAGSIASGILRSGDEIIVLPSHQLTKVKSIISCDKEINEAFAPMPVVLTLEDETDLSRGMVLAKPNNLPLIGQSVEAMIVCMDETPLTIGKEYLLKCNTQSIPVYIKSIRYKYDVNQLTRQETASLTLNDIGRVQLTLQRPLIYDSFRRNKMMGAFILIDRNTNATSGGGIILDQLVEPIDSDVASNRRVDSNNRFISEENSLVSAKQRENLIGHKALTVWLTGLSGSGKSTVARLLEYKLFEKGIHSCILDGDNLRHGLNNDLGFTPDDRSENIRRVAEVAKLMNDAGLVVIAAFVSPYNKDRENARKIIGNKFVEIHVDACIDTCRARDPKGLYAKFDAGAFTGLTGIDSPYEAPDKPDLHVMTEIETAEESADKIFALIQSRLNF
jgi:bifunctional enzyme CysN/CysC